MTRYARGRRPWELQHYSNVLALNVIIVAIDSVMAVDMGLWFVDSVLFYGDSFDHLGMTVLPLFCPLSLMLPACCV